ncbi:MAG TPA: hypothetical protein VKY81_04215 [Natronosporangium sp.]|nr:hypothetical protein [Natronosporangium sp.]
MPINFRLPDGWQAAPPDEVGAPGAAFVALHPASRDGFTANITISGEVRNDVATLEEIADESVERLRRASSQLVVTDRREVGTPDAPGFSQVVRLVADVDGTPRQLVQTQVYLSLLDVDDPRRRVVLELVLTSTVGQLATVIGDFQRFLRTVRPLTPGDRTSPDG